MPSPDNTSIAPAFAVENPIGLFPNPSPVAPLPAVDYLAPSVVFRTLVLLMWVPSQLPSPLA